MNKNFQIMTIEAKLKSTDKDVKIMEFLLLANKKFKGNLTEKQKKELKNDLKKVSMNRSSLITKSASSYSFLGTEFLKNFNFGNTIVEAHLPYCLHIPNNYDFNVNFPEDEFGANVILQKHWTEKSVGSDNVDFFTKEKTTFFNGSEFVSPQFPIDPKLGWEQKFSGKNVEKEKDNNAIFRYTKVIIQFDTNYQKQDLESKKKFDPIINDVSNKSLKIVNRLINVYRFVTEEEFVETLGSLSINNVYFLKHNIGFYVFSMGYGIGDAIMNRPYSQINKISSMLDKGNKPALYNLLILDAESSMNKRSFSLVVIKSYQALEVFLESFIYNGYIKLGKSEEETEKLLNKKWRTKERLKEVIKDITDVNFPDQNNELWQEWCTNYENIRKSVFHKSKEVSETEAKKTLEINKEIIKQISKSKIKETQ